MRTILFLLLSMPSLLFGQIVIDEVGDGWKAKVDSAIQLIKTNAPEAYRVLEENTNHIEFWIGDMSTTAPDPKKGKGTILIAVDEIELGIYNLAAVLVHESLHLHFHRKGIKMDPIQEEITAYAWEKLFLIQLPNCPMWLIQNADFQIRQLSEKR